MKPLSQHIQESFEPQQETIVTEVLDDHVKPSEESTEQKPSDDGTASIMRAEPAKE